MMIGLLLQPVEVTLSGKNKIVPALEALLLVLQHSDAPAASNILAKFEEWARQNSQPQKRTVFVDSEYTRALATKPRKKGTDNDV
jgi:hypothetical protein